MIKKLGRISVLALAAALVIGQTAYADTITSSAPSETGTINNAAQGTFGTVNRDGSKAGYISSTGPTGTKNINEKGYLVIGGGTGASTVNTSSVIGPTGSVQAGETAPSSANASTAASAQTVNLNSSVAQPVIAAEAGVLYDATTNQFLFEKNGSESLAPASTTKLLSALVAAEKLNMGDSFTFNASAVNNLESGAVTVGMKAGDKMTVKDAMNAMLIKSACEVANGIAEAAGGSQAAFADLMNQKAKALGCTNSKFVNASGLNSTEQRSTAHDMALITAAAFNNAEIKAILQTKSYVLPATSGRASTTITTGNKFTNGTLSCDGYLGGKTGYTSKAGNCLASAASVNGHTLVAVVLKANATHYDDTKKLLEYGKKVLGGTTAAAANTQAAAQTTAAAGPTGPASTTNTTAAANTTSAAAGNTAGKWAKQSNGTWKYQKANGTYCTNEWLDLDGKTYFFGADAVMCTGWKQFTNADWYYFNPENGAMVRGKWVTQNDKSYYLQANGVMAKNTVVDGKYKVNENGVFVEKVG